MKFLYLDFEFRDTAEPTLNLVSLACLCTDGGKETCRKSFWLLESDDAKADAAAFITERLDDGYLLVAYALEAEARSLLALLPSRDWLHRPAIDLYLEYRCLLNHNHRYAYGDQLVNGEVRHTTPPKSKWERFDDDDDASHSKPSYGLAAACFKLLGVKIDTDEKESLRTKIISATISDVAASRPAILAYNESDVEHLPALLNAVAKINRAYGRSTSTWLAAAHSRAEYARRTAVMVSAGYPVDRRKVSRLVESIPAILKAGAEECNAAAMVEGFKPFRFCEKAGRYIETKKAIRQWIARQDKPRWRQTSGGDLSTSHDAFRDWYDSQSPGFAGAYLRHLKTKQSLNGFLPGGKKKFAEFVGSDGRVRPYFGIYGSQSSRSQPGAAGFIPLKAHWMRNLISPAPGRAIVTVDYASQEFLIAAVLSQDRAMLDAYASGDVYLAFAKRVSLVPQDATKTSHKAIRDRCKGLVLGISYDMSATGLAPRLGVSVDEAETLIDAFYSAYPDYFDWKLETQIQYRDDGELVLPDGWVMYGDNDNRRSVGNFPVQGHGAVIMRRAVALAQDFGLDVIYTLHDSLAVEFDSARLESIGELKDAMTEAYYDVMACYGETVPIRLDAEAWSPDFAPGFRDGCKFLSEYVDEKGAADLERYSQFIT